MPHHLRYQSQNWATHHITSRCRRARYAACEGGTTLAVCTIDDGNTENGLCNMAGNVYEWVQDEWHDNYEGAPENGHGWCTGDCPINADDQNYDANNQVNHVIRGGAWDYEESFIRSTYRSYAAPQTPYIRAGGRLARSIQ